MSLARGGTGELLVDNVIEIWKNKLVREIKLQETI